MNPFEEYSQRLGRRERHLAVLDRRHERIGTARLVLAAAFLLLAYLCVVRQAAAPGWLLLPAALFAGLVVYHQRLRVLRGRAQRAVDFYRSGIARLEGRHAGRPGDEFSDEHHLYGADLDLFGRHSLFERLCSARTPMGEERLAHWLLAPATLPTIRERHACIAELRDRLELREDLAVLGEPARIVLQSRTITAWSGAADELAQPWVRPAAVTLAILAAASAVLWALRGVETPFLLVLVVEAALTYALRNRVQRCVAGIEQTYEDLRLLAELLRRIEAESFDAAALRALQARLIGAQSASATLSKLATLVNFVEARRNPLLAPLLLPSMYIVHAALAAQRWRARHGREVTAWLHVLGEFEALQSMAGYSFERPDDPFPEFVEGPAAFRASGLGHPLIPGAACVRNDVQICGATRVLLVSGSNMSGKSTLLRSVGMNTVLAMAGAPVCARRLELTALQVGASIRVNDSLREGSSRFYAEITRLRQLFEPVALPLLFLLDELLQGTNSSDRRIGARGVLRALVQRGAIGLVSTHDMALTDDPTMPQSALKNVHFQDELKDGHLTFDFTLRAGIVTKSNGVELMRAIGLDV